VAVVVAPGEETAASEAFCGLDHWHTVAGGAERFDSVRAGLAAIAPAAAEAVLVHDAARPFVSGAVIERLLAALAHSDGAIPVLPAVDTLKRNHGGHHLATADRTGLMRAQTPQAFRLAALQQAMEVWPAGQVPTDDAQVLEQAGRTVATVAGDPMLFKVTYPEDFSMAQALANGSRRSRTGQGFDVHAFGPGDHVWLCGVRIDHDRSLIGHSDADVGLHALTDALLGAIGQGDIGDHFPPSDPKWSGADSSLFVSHAAGLVAAGGGRVANVDVTLICERPKIAPYREAMRARIAELLGVTGDRVNVKATTTEGLGFTGRAEGIAAQAVATVDVDP
jgi:2-C-methyl-D-erythritol 4-phosphate cytidylyltransferase/2-C-methyl-D-erythritol 2,4-cyclodiphosphate synthase